MDRPADRVYFTPDDLADLDLVASVGAPGEFPFTRGIHATGYRGRLWTMRQFAGFGTPEDTNQRYRDLIAAGGTGLSVAFDLPTLMGRDPDDPLAVGEVGRCGVSVASLADMEALFEGIRLDEVSTSMTINGPASMILAMYLALAERQGASWSQLSGTVQNDILKEFIAQKEFIVPPRPSMRLVTDSIVYLTRHVPRWNSVSISGYHIREAGATAAQELAFTLRDGIEYVEWVTRAGLAVDDFAPRLSFFFNAHRDFFEEIAKFRAARRIWATVMRERFGAADPRSWKLRFHAQTAGVTLTAAEPVNNVMRTALEALSAVLGGANSLHANALDEAWALPTAESATLALRTQQILAHEIGVTDTVDPLGGSWYVERLTADLAAEAEALMRRIDEMGGMVAAIERGFPQKAIAESAYGAQRAVETGATAVVGQNVHQIAGRVPIVTLAIDEASGRRQCERVQAVRARRDRQRAERAIAGLERAAAGTENTMEALVECARAYVTVGETTDVLRRVWGEYVEVPAL
jgi:methylmalonyl-CoA mutase N-terminal domain/subunit